MSECGLGQTHYYTKAGAKERKTSVKNKNLNFGAKIMALGVITGRGVLPLKFIPPKVKINSDYYIEDVLKPLVDQWLPKLYPEELQRVFVHHDAAPAHVNKKTTEFMKQPHEIHGINFIHKKDIPVKSPDASPLDFFGFGYLKQQLKQHEVSSIDQLCTTANQIWTEIPLEMVLNVF